MLEMNIIVPLHDVCVTDTNECDAEVCDVNAQCANTDGSYACSCSAGYSGSGENCTGN